MIDDISALAGGGEPKPPVSREEAALALKRVYFLKQQLKRELAYNQWLVLRYMNENDMRQWHEGGYRATLESHDDIFTHLRVEAIPEEGANPA